MKITLVYGVANEEKARELRGRIANFRNVEIVSCGASEFATSHRLDGEYLPVTAAEKWGAVPLPGRAQILPIPLNDRSRLGMPGYIIAGGALSTVPRNKGEELSLVVESVIDAVAAHNNMPKAFPILRVGVWEEWLRPDVGPDEVGRRLVDALMKLE